MDRRDPFLPTGKKTTKKIFTKKTCAVVVANPARDIGGLSNEEDRENKGQEEAVDIVIAHRAIHQDPPNLQQS
jgi:hypothetical protein